MGPGTVTNGQRRAYGRRAERLLLVERLVCGDLRFAVRARAECHAAAGFLGSISRTTQTSHESPATSTACCCCSQLSEARIPAPTCYHVGSLPPHNPSCKPLPELGNAPFPEQAHNVDVDDRLPGRTCAIVGGKFTGIIKYFRLSASSCAVCSRISCMFQLSSDRMNIFRAPTSRIWFGSTDEEGRYIGRDVGPVCSHSHQP